MVRVHSLALQHPLHMYQRGVLLSQAADADLIYRVACRANVAPFPVQMERPLKLTEGGKVSDLLWSDPDSVRGRVYLAPRPPRVADWDMLQGHTLRRCDFATA